MRLEKFCMSVGLSGMLWCGSGTKMSPKRIQTKHLYGKHGLINHTVSWCTGNYRSKENCGNTSRFLTKTVFIVRIHTHIAPVSICWKVHQTPVSVPGDYFEEWFHNFWYSNPLVCQVPPPGIHIQLTVALYQRTKTIFSCKFSFIFPLNHTTLLSWLWSIRLWYFLHIIRSPLSALGNLNHHSDLNSAFIFCVKYQHYSNITRANLISKRFELGKCSELPYLR